MQIIDFASTHIKRAAQIALQNYKEECGYVSALPPLDSVPDLTPFVGNGLGVSAFDGDSMLGFLCSVSPFKNAFRSTDATGVFSPMGANGAIIENRAGIYARLYQAAGEKWARAGASSHAVCLYSHDRKAQEQFFRYGFGMRSIDAIREMDEIIAPSCPEYDFFEITPNELLQILPLDHLLDAHMAASPCFILRPSHTEDSFIKQAERYRSVFIVAKKDGQIVAYIRAELDGETFVCDMPGYLHVKGAFCLPEHRGKGVYQNLLGFLVKKLKSQGHTRLGLDFESINPTASGFWPKYFSVYTHSVVRRIDEHAVAKSY